ncbi:4-amino-4-deoxy-L-arabinose transferase [Pustulibacterium marinum]|uniref:4-amino-4-deoxy-L-arabinose transferase n=1 Tax=Pustulibacterium marinum TaxID=1224947 RepID=A0A1I7IUZ1_9FLAO|nr:glycosyltransferase family 39 protein [Pustulibacterium marinum]SFU76753.1 4-amino-4-deoxy-L-arabinose transferase [Pustulibacterium marinum]
MKINLTTTTSFYILYFLIAIVYTAGLFIPVMESDSAQHATMAMRMVLNNDFIHLYKGVDPYLDKPHMHFWLAAISMKIFGINHVAYRIPALLFTLLGAYSCYRLFNDLYKNKSFSHAAAAIFLTSQTIILANHDVRTDAVLTGAVIFSIWQLNSYLQRQSYKSIILGALGSAIAFSTKGHLGIFVIGLSILCQIIYTKNYKPLISLKTLVGLGFFVLGITPVLYAFYIQFDLHPEIMINETNNHSGLKFILWDHSFNRMAAKDFQKSNDNFFFFHSLLWVFFPWSIAYYIGTFETIQKIVKRKKLIEILSIGGSFITLVLISFSKSKLPHYLNSLIPLMSIFVAGYFLSLKQLNKTKTINFFLGLSYFIAVISCLAIIGLYLIRFNTTISVTTITGTLILVGLSIILISQTTTKSSKLIITSCVATILLNFNLNTYFYPNLLKYQSGESIANYIHNNTNLNHLPIHQFNNEYKWSLDFYLQKNIDVIQLENSKFPITPFLSVTNNYEELKPKLNMLGFKSEIIQTFKDYKVSRLSLKFLNSNKRDSQLEKSFLIKVYK